MSQKNCQIPAELILTSHNQIGVRFYSKIYKTNLPRDDDLVFGNFFFD